MYRCCFIQALETHQAGEHNEFITVESTSGLKLILGRKKVRQEKEALLSTYRIPADRSADLVR